MASEYFFGEDDLLKHHVRVNGWLPNCKKRLASIRETDERRLRYFTFCAAGAVDVLMLDVARVIRPSQAGRFDTVYFFDRKPDDVAETKKNIPGAIGFTGDFVEIVLLNDPEDPNFDNPAEGDDPLVSPEGESNETQVHAGQIVKSMRKDFIKSFPFDVINLDLQDFLFKPKQPIPGELIETIRKILNWQKRLIVGSSKKITEFSLMFTTQIGPPNLNANYNDMLKGILADNLANNSDLGAIMEAKLGHANPEKLLVENFDTFFKLATPKILCALVKDEDWYVEPETGITSFEFERTAAARGSYKMLHLVMNIKRADPPKERRAPGSVPPAVNDSYKAVVEKIFTDGTEIVTDESIDKTALSENYRLILGRRKKYSGE